MKFRDFITEDSNLDIENQEKIDYNYSLDQIIEILSELDQDELNEVGDCILELIYDPEFDDEEDELEESELNEIRYFDTRKRELKKARKKNLSQRKKDKKLRKMYYKQNKAKIKRKQKLYKRRVKLRPTMVRKHKK